MKRAPELIPLSHDHHQALRTAQLLRRATASDLDDVLAHLNEFWTEHGADHFALEERRFTPELSADERWAGALARMHAEHEDIRRRAVSVDSVEAARELGNVLHAHVRFEERELFPMVEASL